MERREVVALCLVLLTAPVGVLVAGAARSEDAIRVRVDFAAKPGCPSQARFVDEVRARSPRVRLAKPDEDAIVLVVRVDGSQRRIAGTVSVRADGAETTRSLDGASCSEVVAGLALIAAMAIDPMLREPEAVAPDASASSTASAASSASSSASAAPPDAAPPPSAPDAAAPPAAPSASTPRTPNASWQTSVGAEASFVTAPTPATLVGALVYVDVARRAPVWSPSARLRLERSLVVDDASAGAAFTWTAASLDGCPTAWTPGALRIEACLRAHGGLLQVVGTNVTPARDRTRPWVSLGPVARLRWMLASPFILEIEGALVAPLLRDRFFTEPSTTVYRPPAIGWSAAAGAGVAIW